VEAADGIQVTAIGDLFENRLRSSRAQLEKYIGDSLDLGDRTYTGFDNYKRVLETDVDYVILAAPPYYRPEHLQACVDAEKHVFFEKPVAVDPPGVRSIVETGKEAEEKGVSLVTGTIYRRQNNYVEAIDKIHNGEIGEVVGAQEYYLTGSIWLRERKPGMSDLEWQARNWYYFTWLSGDHIVEQFVHNLDAINWVFDGHPVKASASGGRQQRVSPSYGHIYDHFSVEYTYPNGARVLAMCRQMESAERRVANRVVGTQAVAEINPGGSAIRSHSGEMLWSLDKNDENPYVTEHTDLINSIRNGEPINETEEIAHSTMTAILGREAAYTGKEIAWDDLYNEDRLKLGPEKLAFGPAPTPSVPVPGSTTLDRSW
jgi:predicted dehydrogenase